MLKALQSPMRRNQRGFTLIEVVISVFILLLLVTLAVPSLDGVLADRRLRRSFDQMNDFVRLAQQRSVTERRAYLISWQKDHLALQAESFMKDEDPRPAATMQLRKGDAFVLSLPAALIEEPPADWVFWPSGTCEPAVISYKGVDGAWSATYSPLTARPELTRYATK
jgi:prepilin-type N-terminal cleavage/methylation domain-containing protein